MLDAAGASLDSGRHAQVESAHVRGDPVLLDRAAADQGQAVQHVHGLTQLLVAC